MLPVVQRENVARSLTNEYQVVKLEGSTEKERDAIECMEGIFSDFVLLKGMLSNIQRYIISETKSGFAICMIRERDREKGGEDR